MKLFYFLLILILPVSVAAQQTPTEFDSRLKEIFELDYLNAVQNHNPTLIKRWTFYLDNSYYLADYDLKKFSKNLPTIIIDDLNQINILKIEKEQKIQKDWLLPKAFKIKNTQKILVYRSGKELNRRFQKDAFKAP